MIVVLWRIADRASWGWVFVPGLAENQDLAPCRRQKIESDFEQRGFATAIRSYQAEHTTSRDGEVDLPQN